MRITLSAGRGRRTKRIRRRLSLLEYGYSLTHCSWTTNLLSELFLFFCDFAFKRLDHFPHDRDHDATVTKFVNRNSPLIFLGPIGPLELGLSVGLSDVFIENLH